MRTFGAAPRRCGRPISFSMGTCKRSSMAYDASVGIFQRNIPIEAYVAVSHTVFYDCASYIKFLNAYIFKRIQDLTRRLLFLVHATLRIRLIPRSVSPTQFYALKYSTLKRNEHRHSHFM